MKKKGFTLIELLAVIVILAVIALITVPMIMNVIEDTRKGAFKDSVMSAFHEVEYYLLENNLSEIQEGGIEVTSLKLDNNEFEYGIIIQNEEGELEAVNVSDGKYCASGAMTALEVHKGECDAEAPEVEVSVEGKVATISLSDNIGVIAYAITKKDEEVTDWIEVEETTEVTKTYEATEAGEYTAWVKDKYGKVSSQDFTIEKSAFGSIVHYIVNNETYTETINSGESVLEPQTFTPSKDGAAFQGWSLSVTSTDVLTDQKADGNEITLYAVWKYNNKIDTSYQNLNDPGWDCYGSTFDKTWYSNIDMSLYSGIKVKISANTSVNWAGHNWVVSMNCGGASSQIMRPYCDNSVPQNCFSSSYNGTLTLTFKSTSGTTSLTSSVSSTGTNGRGYIAIDRIELIGRLVVDGQL